MVAAMEAQQSRHGEEPVTRQHIHPSSPSPVKVAEGPDSEMKDEIMGGSRDG